MDKPVSKTKSLEAFQRLDELLSGPVVLLLGGGGAMILAHGFPLATTDIDALPTSGISIAELDPLVKKIAQELRLPPDWLNPYFSTFLHVLPQDHKLRLRTVFQGGKLRVDALGATDMLILKCFAGRQKDIGHAKALLKKDADISLIESHLETLKKKNIPGVDRAFEFLDEILDQE